MKYILVGKKSATLNGIKSKLSKNVTICNSVKEMDKTDTANSKIIYIATSIPYNWEWWMSVDVNNEYNRKQFIEETVDFKNIDTDCCDKIIEYDGTGLSDVIEEIEKYITEVEDGSNSVFN